MVYNKRIILSAIALFFVSSVIFLFITACEGIFPVPEPITFTITASTVNNGSIDPEGKTIVYAGEDQGFAITSDEGCEVEDVLVDGGSVGAVSEYTFTDVKQDHTIQVIFLKKTQPLPTVTVKKYAITSLAATGGTINPSGEITVTEGADQSFIITPDANYIISDVLVDDLSVGAVSEYIFADIKQDHTIEAKFIGQFIITASAGDGGSINPSEKTVVNWGENKSFTIIAKDGYQIIDIKIDGILLENFTPINTYTYTFPDIQANHTIEASFIQQFTITASAGDNGNIEPEGEISISKGESLIFTITPDICYQIEKITINETEEVEARSPYTIDDIQEDYNIEVNFTISDKKIRRYNQDGEIQQDDYTSIHAAINDENTIDSDTIIVCPGTYHENLTFDGSKNITVQSVDPQDSDITTATIINGDIDEDEIGDGSVVSFISGDTSTLKGFTITNGIGTLMGSHSAGGGICIDSSSPNILNNIIENNASANGGGIFIAGNSSPEIEKNIIRDNESTNMAGGIYIFKCSPNIIDNNISGNLTNTYGGGIYVFEGYKESLNHIAYNVIENNQANNGGGIYLTNASPRLVNNDIKNNNANNYGGGIYIESCSPDITENNFISGNSAANGGGIYTKNAYIDSEKTITGNAIVNNTASSAGGGFYIENSSPLIFENTIGSSQNNQVNSARWGGGIYMINSNSCKVEKNTISGNTANIGGAIYLNRSLPKIKENTISYNIVNDIMAGSGGIYVNSYSRILPDDISRPTEWGKGRGNIPSTSLDDPPKDVEYQIAGNTFLGNEHSDTAGNMTYSEGAHVYFQ